VSGPESLAGALARLEDNAGWEGVVRDQSAPPELRVQLSIAFSLKRIADAICGDDRNSGIADAIWELVNRGAR
jgi:hypothetical protein